MIMKCRIEKINVPEPAVPTYTRKEATETRGLYRLRRPLYSDLVFLTTGTDMMIFNISGGYVSRLSEHDRSWSEGPFVRVTDERLVIEP